MLTALLLAPFLLLGSSAEIGEEVDLLCTRLAAHGFSGSVLVARGDEVLLRRGYGLADREAGRAIGPETIFDIGSVTKQFTATAVLLLEERGQLSTDDTLDAFFEGLPKDLRGITLDQLLGHTSGLPRSIPAGAATTERDALIDLLRKAEPVSAPGAEYVYNNIGYLVLAAVVEVVSERSFEGFLREELFAPAGLEDTDFLQTGRADGTRTAVGYEGERVYGPAQEGWYSWGLRGAGGVLSTTGDLHRWVRAVRGGKVLGKRGLEKLFEEQAGTGYARGWMVVERGALGLCIYHGGTTRGFEAALETYPDREFVVIVLCNDRGTAKSVAFDVAQVASGLKQAPTALRATEPSELAALAGRFLAKGGEQLRVRAGEDHLVLEASPEALVRLSTGKGAEKLKRNKKLEAKATKALDLLRRRRLDELAESLDPRFAGWNHTLGRVLAGWERERGSLLTASVLGTRSKSVYVTLRFSERPALLEMLFRDGLWTGFELNAGVPGDARFLATEAGDFEALEVGGWSRATLRFEKRGRLRLQVELGSTQRKLIAERSAAVDTGDGSEQQGPSTLALAGLYRVAPKGTLTVRAEGPLALSLELDTDALVALATGGTTRELTRDRAAEKQFEELFENLEAGDSDRLEELVTDRFPGWHRTLLLTYRSWEKAWGPLERVRSLGSAGGRAYTELVFERRALLFGGSVSDGRLIGYVLDGHLDPSWTLARSGNHEFDHEEPGPIARSASLRIVPSKSGRPTNLLLIMRGGPGPESRVEASRKGGSR